MPSAHTFTIKPIGELISRYVGSGKNWVDPFAGFNSPSEITNDLNPEAPTTHHVEAIVFMNIFENDSFDGWDVWGNEVESDIEL